MADVKALAEQLVGLTVKEVQELADVLKADYGIEPAAAAVVVSGDGGFVLDDQATLGIGHQDGICSAEAKGNIQTSTRLFNSGGIYMYYTLSQPQQTGMFVTTPEPNAVRCLVLDKDRSGMKVNLSNDLKVTEKVMITKGDLREGEHDLIMPRMSAKN